MIKEGILECWEGRTTERAERQVHTIDYSSYEFYKSYLMIEAKIQQYLVLKTIFKSG